MAGRGAVQLCGYLRASLRDTDKRLDLRTFYLAERSRRRMRPTGRALSNSAQAARRRLQHATGHCIFHSEFSKEYYPADAGSTPTTARSFANGVTFIMINAVAKLYRACLQRHSTSLGVRRGENNSPA